MSWYNPLTWFRDDDTGEYTTLYKVKWEVEGSYPEVTRRIVWEGGEAITITYIERGGGYGLNHVQQWIDWSGKDILIEEKPAYTEVVERVEDGESYTRTKSTWMESPIPDDLERMGESKRVREDEGE